MLDINFEFRRGILFIRLSGVLTRSTIEDFDSMVTTLIRDNGIRNVVFNVSGLFKIDFKGISRLFYNYELCKRNRGVSLLCCADNIDIHDKIESTRLFKYMVDEELNIDDAIKREKRLKRWNRPWKINLIEKDNAEWKDLAESIGITPEILERAGRSPTKSGKTT